MYKNSHEGRGLRERGSRARRAAHRAAVHRARNLFGPVLVCRGGERNGIGIAYGAVFANFLLVSAAVIAMVLALVTHDFSVSYVAQVGSRSTPLLFTVISLWGALEGSILFWGWRARAVRVPCSSPSTRIDREI